MIGKIPNSGVRKCVRLLVVGDTPQEDSSEYYFHLQEFVDLSRHVYDISYQFTTSCNKAVELIESWQPSIILVDAHLEDSHSFDVLQSGIDASVPVVVTSEFNSPEIGESAMANGAAAYLPKSDSPEDLEILFSRIAELAVEIRIKH